MKPMSLSLWDSGQTYADYRRSVTRNPELLDEAYGSPVFDDQDLWLLRQLPPLRLLAVGEEWCPDVYHTLPNWARLVTELEGWDLRVFRRDGAPDVMTPFLWRGDAKRIPVYGFFDARGWLQTWWSGRGREAQEWIDLTLGGRKLGDLSPEERADFSRRMDEQYRRAFRRANFRELVALLGAFYHIAPGR